MDYAKIISAAARDMRPSGIRKFFDIAAEMKDCISLGVGEPDFKTPWTVRDAGIRSLEKGRTWYTSNSGLAELREETCNYLSRRMGLSYTPGETVVTVGGSEAIDMCIRALVNPGDEVVIPAPYWVSYSEIVRMCGGVPVIAQTREEDEFKLTPQELDEAITDNTKCVIFNSPSNPTGMMYTREELRALADVCIARDVYIIADEIYYKLVYDGREFVSIAALGEDVKERTILINGVSKSYAMTGWRIGYSLAPENITKVMSNYVSHSTAAPSTLSQWAAVEALTGPQDTVETMRQAFEERRNYMVDRVNAMELVSCLKPEGAFYIMMNIRKVFGKKCGDVVIDSCDTFASQLLEKGLVAVVPGSGFDAPNYVRWSYATSLVNIKEGMDRLEKFLSGLTD